MKIFVSAGEVSGDEMLGAVLGRLRETLPELQIRGLGGSAAESHGLSPLFPLEKTAVSGVWDVLRRAFFLFRMYRTALAVLKDFHPDLVLLVDYPGLNLRLAAKAHAMGKRVCYLAPPQAWAYQAQSQRTKRAVRVLRGCSVHVLFPFETKYFSGSVSKVTVGHFLVSAPALPKPPVTRRPILLLCPGSRVPVWGRNLPVWLERLLELNVLGVDCAFPQPEIQVLMPAHLAAMSREWLRKFQGGKFVPFVTIQTDKKSALADADWALAFPGTLTLELALSQVPTAILAVMDPLTLAVGKRLLRSTRLGLPNLLLEEEVFSEWVGVSAELTKVKFQKVLQDLWAWNRAWEPLQERLSRVLGTGNGAEIVAGECMRLVNASQLVDASH